MQKLSLIHIFLLLLFLQKQALLLLDRGGGLHLAVEVDALHVHIDARHGQAAHGFHGLFDVLLNAARDLGQMCIRDRFSIAYDHRPRLRSRLTLGG